MDSSSEGVIQDELLYQYEESQFKCETNDKTIVLEFDQTSRNENKDNIKIGKKMLLILKLSE